MKYVVTLCFVSINIFIFAQVDCVETDFNNDGSIGSSDLLQFLSFYGSEWPIECDDLDFNNDGSIGSSDLLQFLSFYGNEWPIVNTGIGCGDVFFQDYTYATVVIGDQCWFSENCRYLPEVSPNSSSSIDMPVYYVYGYEGQNVEEAKSTTNYNLYGVLYNWLAVQDSDVCPNGWHVSSDADWNLLEITLGMDLEIVNSQGFRGTDQGEQMKSESGWSNEGNGTNASGLNILPGGWRYAYNGFYHAGDDGVFWTNSLALSSEYYAWARRFVYNNQGVERENPLITSGFSVRCVQD